MRTEVLDIRAESYHSHWLHDEGNDWIETNCVTDMWIEVIHSLGLDPVPGLAFTVGVDFGGDQWTMFGYPAEDLLCLYGIRVNELNVWRPLLDHIEEQIELGNMVSFDVDAYHLPDTRGISYRQQHQKTTICAQTIDREGRWVGYFHNAGYAELSGDDFDGIFDPGIDEGGPLPPFTDQIRLDGIEKQAPELDVVIERLRTHLRRSSTDNPVSLLARRMEMDSPLLSDRGLDYFHRYAFGTCRQLGANGQLAAAFVDWLADVDDPTLRDVSSLFREVSAGAKRVEFILGRIAAGRRGDIRKAMQPLELAWADATAALTRRYGG
jgi:hypothetical protein